MVTQAELDYIGEAVKEGGQAGTIEDTENNRKVSWFLQIKEEDNGTD